MEQGEKKWVIVTKGSGKHPPRAYKYTCKYLSWVQSVIWISLRLGSWTLSMLSRDENAVQLSRQQSVSIACTVLGGPRLNFSLNTSHKSDICLQVLLTNYAALVLFSVSWRLHQPTAAEMMFSSVKVACCCLVLLSETELNYKVPKMILLFPWFKRYVQNVHEAFRSWS